MELLFDERLVAGRRYSGPTAAATVEQALTQILAGSGLIFRKLPSGAFVILAAKPDSENDLLAGSLPAPIIADILVTGRRTLNTDIRRGADDPQPYQTAPGGDIDASQSATADEFLKSRLPQNAQALSLNQAPFGSAGAVRSQIDLRGMGTGQTLVLVNGRRLPSIPGLGELLQPDVSGVPVHSLDRIETLATTAGGIFGIGAGGGVVNLITRNDFDDATVIVRSGISQRGDGGQRLLDAHLGFTSRSGHTRISLRYTRGSDDGLTFGSRNFIEESRTLRYQRDGSQNYLPVSAGVNVVSAYGSTLSLLPALGGQSLGASATYLPLDAAPVSAGGAATLLANAGHLDLTLAPDAQGAQQSLLTPTKTNAVMATVRQNIGTALEVYADYLRLKSTGRAVIAGLQTSTDLAVGERGNPFAQPIVITYPTAGLLGEARSDTLTDRITVGAIMQLGGGWVANLDLGTGQATARLVATSALPTGSPINVFAGAASLSDQLSRLTVQPDYRTYATNRLRDGNFRVAGPLVMLPAGPVAVTLTGEMRDERAPGASYESYLSTPSLRSTALYPSARQAVGSLFAEARVPLFRQDGPASPMRGLELQIAVRSDLYEISAPVTDSQLLQLGTFRTEVRNKGMVTAVTASVRTTPIDGITLRASFADGYSPPTPSQITPSGISVGFSLFADPKRPRDSLVSTVNTLYLSGGQPGLRPQHSRTWSIGAILRPNAIPGLRLSADFSILRTDHEITDFGLGQFQYFVTNEALYPGRITRAPLTAADVTAGYTAGRITRIDASYLSTGNSTLNALDLALDYDRVTSLGHLRISGQATWEPKLRHGALNASSYDTVNSANGPVSIRASGGVALSRGAWAVGVNGRAYGSYRIDFSYQPGSLYAASYAQLNTTRLIEQGSSHIPAQAYLDAWTTLSAGKEFTRPRAAITYRLGIKNLLNKTPPLVVPPISPFDGIGYSPLGDARGRQFEMEISASF